MKNIRKIMFIFLFVIVICALGSATGEPEQTSSPAAATLPQNLEVIEEGAFEGTAFTNVVLPGKVIMIEDRAFANNPMLIRVSIPGSTGFIGERAFDGDDFLILSGYEGSYAQEWARRRYIGFVVQQEIRHREKTFFAVLPAERKVKMLHTAPASRTVVSLAVKEQRTGRAAGELKASFYTGKDSVYVQSRYFP